MKLKFKLNPNGAGCKHIHIDDLSDNRIIVTTEEEIETPIHEHDKDILRQLKRSVDKHLKNGKTKWNQVKQEIELEEFDY